MRETEASSHLPELEGLRALAIVAVVLFHTVPQLVPGGFLGVDMFFVISGFVITRKILSQVALGAFSLRDFYLGRIYRLLPALAVTLLMVWLGAWWLMFPSELKVLANSSLAVLTGIANLHFARHLDYFAPTLEAHPLLHTWSLAVEGQFYLLFAALLSNLLPRSRLRWGLVVLSGVVLSAVLVWLVPRHAFFALESRAWQLGLGALLTIGGIVKLNAVWSWMGAAMVLGSFMLNSVQVATPVPGSLCVTAGTALWIASRAGGPGCFWHHGLTLAPWRYVGRLSYALYLVHWPVLVFAPRILPAWRAEEKFLAVLLSIALAMMLHHLVETPARRVHSPLQAGLLTALTIGLMCGSGWVRFQQGWIGSPAEASLRRVWPQCDQPKSETERWLNLGTASQPPEFLLVGDSHAQCLVPGLNEGLRRNHRSAAAWVAHATLPLQGIETSVHSLQLHQEVLPEVMRSQQAHTVVLMASWSYYLSEHAFPLASKDANAHHTEGYRLELMSRSLNQTLQQLSASGRHVILVEPVPSYPVHIPELLVRRSRWSGQQPDPAFQTMHDYHQRHSNILKMLRDAQARFPGVQILKTSALFEKNGALIYQQDGLSLYEDSSHLSRLGAERIVNALLDMTKPSL